MNWQGNMIVFGSLVVLIALGVAAAIVGGTAAKVMWGIVVLGSIFWLVMAFQILSAMNSDI